MLWRKMLRDLKENKGAYIACIVIMVVGLMVFTSFSMVLENITVSQEDFYFKQNFADGFAEVRAMPFGAVEGLQSLPGIKEIEGRLVKDVRVLLPGREDNVYLRLVSINPQAANPVNGVRLEQGIALREEKMNIWVDNKFFAANRLELNEEIEIIAAGKKRNLHIVGVGNSPEFIYALRSSADLFPKPEEFGIAFIPYEVMKTLFQEKGTVNSIVFTLQPGTNYQEVEDLLRPQLEAYGLTAMYPRKDQTSHLLLSGELESLQSMVKILPIIFLTVASVILYIMLRRQIENQRVQIGILKALGYTRGEIITHYLSYALIIGLAGGVLGGALGVLLSRPFTSIYQIYFNLPGLGSRFSPSTVFLAVVLGLVFTAFAGYRGCRGVLTLEPAEAMRPRSPLPGKSVLLEKLTFFWQMLTVQGKMAVRNISRHKGRSAFILVGIMFTFALIGGCWSMWEMAENMIYDQFEKVETYDARISLYQPLDRSKVERELSRFPGVKRVESKLEIPVTLKHQWRQKDVVLIGLPFDSELHRINDDHGRQVRPPTTGLLVSQRMADLLEVEQGSRIVLESPMLKDPTDEKEVEIAGVIPQYMGLNAYIEIEALQSLLQQGELVTTVMLSMEEEYLPLLRDEYQYAQAINGIEDRNKMLRQLKELMGSYSGTIYIMLLFGVIVGFAIIYNSSIITVSERSRELASMMVLGMTPAEVLSVVTFEQWFLSVFGMLAGIPLIKIFLVGVASSLNNDVYSIPTSFGVSTIVIGCLITVASVWVAQRAAARRINRLVIADVLKAGE